MSQAWAFFLLVLFSCCVSNHLVNGERVFLFPQSQKVSSIVSKRYRTAYHFQPPKNWINGMSMSLCYLSAFLLTLGCGQSEWVLCDSVCFSCSCSKKKQVI
ncbi:hypothetical protein ACQ4PT_044403 [Festuca glaucescens]